MRASLLVPLPLVVTLLLSLVVCLPWGGPPWSETALMLLPAASIYYWSLRRPQLMPALLVFACGLLLDVLTHGPLGVWAVAALAVALAGRKARRIRPALGWLRSAAAAIATFAIALALATGLEGAFAWRPIALLPQLHALAAICMAYPVLAGLLSVLDPLWPAPDGRSLFARGD
jgi:rod shape-determining protein MreD